MSDRPDLDQLDPACPFFDVTLLGLGPDGHTLTYPLLESSRTVAFLVAGAEKREILARLLQGDRDLPSARLAAVGKMRLFADTAATGRSAP
jgi:6-phosphogluconolactonase